MRAAAAAARARAWARAATHRFTLPRTSRNGYLRLAPSMKRVDASLVRSTCAAGDSLYVGCLRSSAFTGGIVVGVWTGSPRKAELLAR